jgi:hypothetical protein
MLTPRAPGRRTVAQAKASRLPVAWGVNASDPRFLDYLNEATERGMGLGTWWGTYSRIAICVEPVADGCLLTWPRTVARLEAVAVNRSPLRIENLWYEFLLDGMGLQPASTCNNCNPGLQLYDRNPGPLVSDIVPSNKALRTYVTLAADVGKRILFKGYDDNDVFIRTLDGANYIDGEFVVLASPFADTVSKFSRVTAVIKDPTEGNLTIKEVDTTTSVERTVADYEPTELVPMYRRSIIPGMKGMGCASPNDQCTIPGQKQIEAIAVFEFVPVTQDTDTLLISNIPALKELGMSIRFGEMDTPAAVPQEQRHLRNAVKLLNDELTHYIGKARPAIGLKVFGSAALSRRRIGALV